jgi:23S rRNA (cytidine1920-2'-O)/16S rRNA (cytidine1409-2'-O)-methyltransferase
VTTRRRLDAELVRRGLARSREQAARLIDDGRVSVSGVRATKAATAVDPAVAVVVRPDAIGPDFVSRGGHKLAGAIAAFGPMGLTTAGRLALDAGASTGGFTDVLLRAGVSRVIAVDVGYGQLDWSLQTDERVQVLDRTNVRALTSDALDGARPELVVGDLSFISLTLVLPVLARVSDPGADLVLLVKPQFEVGRARLGKGGVVRDLSDRRDAVLTVADAAAALGLGYRGCCASPLPGPAGNVEFFLWLTRGAGPVDADEVRAVVAAAPVGREPGSEPGQ